MIAADIEHYSLNYVYQVVRSHDGKGFQVRWGASLVSADVEPQVYVTVVAALRAVCRQMERNRDHGFPDMPPKI